MTEDQVWAEKKITEQSMAGAKKAAEKAQTESIAAADSNEAATKEEVHTETQKNVAKVSEEHASQTAVQTEHATSMAESSSEQAENSQTAAQGSVVSATSSESRGQDQENTANMYSEDSAHSMHLATKSYESTESSSKRSQSSATYASSSYNNAATSASFTTASAAEASRSATASYSDSRNAASAMEVSTHEETLGQRDTQHSLSWSEMAYKLRREAQHGDFQSTQAREKSVAAQGTCFEALKSNYPNCEGYEQVGYTCVEGQCAGLDVLGDRDLCARRMPPGTMPNSATGKCEPVDWCWQALKTDYPACEMYEESGYLCVGNQCAALNPQGTPDACAKIMPAGTVPDPATGTCQPVEPMGAY